MKTRILTVPAIVLVTLASTSAKAEDEKKFTIIGLWQTTTTIDDVFVHDIQTFNPNGTGIEDVYMTSARGSNQAHMPFYWSFNNNVLRLFFHTGDIHSSNVVIVNRTTFVSTQFAGALQLIGIPLRYTLQEDQDDEGCMNAPAPKNKTAYAKKTPADTVPAPTIRRRHRRSFPV